MDSCLHFPHSMQATKEVINEHVELLKALKAEYKQETGREYSAPGVAPVDAAKPSKVEKKASADVVKPVKIAEKKAPAAGPAIAAPAPAAVVTPPALPVKKPVYVTPAPTAKAGGGQASATSTPVGGVDLAALDAKLAVQSYVAGFVPTAEDQR